MKPVNAMTVIAGTSSVPRNDVNQGPRIGLLQSSGRNAVRVRRFEPWTDGPPDGWLAGLIVGSRFGDSVTDKVDP